MSRFLHNNFGAVLLTDPADQITPDWLCTTVQICKLRIDVDDALEMSELT